LTQAHRAKDQFLAMLAHELRNPLAPIRNAVRILQQLGPPEPRLERARAIIDRQVSHQARLLDDLFDVSRLTRGMTTLCKERLDLAQLIRHVADDSQGLMEQAGVTFSEEIPEESVWVEGDPIRLAQIVGNLCGNAAKFTERGGHVGLRLAVEAEKKRAVITVRDTGIGIDPEMLPRVFDVFAQADQSLHRSPGGLGLGLALVKGLTELHGGQVRAASEGPGCGSEFTVLLPLASAPVTGETVRVPVTPSARPARVLIVEDSRDTAETLRDVLELSGNTVGVAYSGPEAVELARQFQPGVVLCDLGLPGMDGYEVAKALRRDPETQAARLIAVSGYGQEEDVQRSREAGFDLHLTKPIDLERLERILAISTEEETSPSIAATRPNDAYPNGR
jgi:CheY-like chemotaxis protein/two-component sensor histidine kinase